jgi:hypothetical protein
MVFMAVPLGICVPQCARAGDGFPEEVVFLQQIQMASQASH